MKEWNLSGNGSQSKIEPGTPLTAIPANPVAPGQFPSPRLSPLQLVKIQTMETLHLFSPFPCLWHCCSLCSEIFNKLSISIRRSFDRTSLGCQRFFCFLFQEVACGAPFHPRVAALDGTKIGNAAEE